ncbi:hypothetical protein YB2330_006653 [Saitoella coloradoensis]
MALRLSSALFTLLLILAAVYLKNVVLHLTTNPIWQQHPGKVMHPKFLAGVLAASAAGSASASASVNAVEVGNGSVLNANLTRDVVPIPVHSHNDYWRTTPLLSALSYGLTSVEADVWLINGTLFVGHDRGALNVEKTFASLYIDPLVQLLENINQNDGEFEATGWNGVFSMDNTQSLQLLVDLKTDGPETWPYVLKALEPLRERGWLTNYNGSAVTNSAVTVVGTGNTPLQQVLAQNSTRDAFFDAPLASLNATFTPAVSPLASTNWAKAVGWNGIRDISQKQRQAIRDQVATAHAAGLKVRYWGYPNWPVWARDNIWKVLVEEGVDWLNVDDLSGIAEF